MGLKNTLLDLNNYLFAQMERLDEEELTPEELEKEIKRANAMKDISTQIIANANIVLQANKFNMEWSRGENVAPRMLLGDKE